MSCQAAARGYARWRRAAPAAGEAGRGGAAAEGLARCSRAPFRPMLFSTPDYPLFLIAVFFLYALSRGGAGGRWARIAVMVLLGDLVFMLIAKDPDLLWDPLGNVLYRLAGNYYSDATLPWPLATMAWHWVVGLAVIGGAVAVGMRAAGWLAVGARPADRRGRPRRGRRSRPARRLASRGTRRRSTTVRRDRRARAPRGARDPRHRHRRRAGRIVRARSAASSCCSSRRACSTRRGRSRCRGAYKLPPRAAAGHDRPRLLPRDLDRAGRGAARAQGARDRQPVLEPRHLVLLQVRVLRGPDGARV